MSNPTRRYVLLLFVLTALLLPGLASFRRLSAQDGRKTPSAAALLQLKQVTPKGAFPRSEPETSFEVFLRTQVGLLKSDSVLRITAASPQVAALKLFEGRDAVEALRSNLAVEFEPNSELVTVRYTHPDRKTAATVVRAVVTAYLDLTDREERDRLDRLSTLRKHLDSLLNNLKLKRRAIADLSRDHLAPGAAAGKERIRAASLTKDRLELRKADLDARIAASKETGKSVDDLKIESAGVEARLNLLAKQLRALTDLDAAEIPSETERIEFRVVEETTARLAEELERAELETSFRTSRVSVVGLPVTN